MSKRIAHSLWEDQASHGTIVVPKIMLALYMFSIDLSMRLNAPGGWSMG